MTSHAPEGWTSLLDLNSAEENFYLSKLPIFVRTEKITRPNTPMRRDTDREIIPGTAEITAYFPKTTPVWREEWRRR